MEIGNTSLENLIRQIVLEAKPLKIILFGSAVKKGITDAGDLDLMVVVPDGMHCRKMAQQLYQNIRNIGKPFDLIVTTPEILERHKDNIGLMYRTILSEGVELYVA